jgi:hypothetical protein
MKELYLLIVEDDEKVQHTYKRDIDSYNLVNKSVNIVYEIIGDKDTSLSYIRDISNHIDAAIVDLDLLGIGVGDSSGNEVIKEIKQNLRFPVFVISSTPQNVEEDIREESSLFKIKARGEEGDFLEEFVDIFNTGITHILNKKGTIEKYITTIFWEHLSNSIDIWVEDKERTPEEKHKSLLRYTLLHIQEYLELTEESGFEDYHPAEIYITPVIKPNVFTGDLVNKNETDEYFIVLTPSCDLAQAKAKDILLVNLEPVNSSIINEKVKVISKNEASPEVLEEAKIILQKLIHNTYSNKYHFLPKYKEINGGLINFQKLSSVRVKEFNKNFNRIASINSGFTKDIVARFSYYYSRQGSPDFNSNEIYESLFK